MKQYNGFILIALSIVIGATIISIPIYNKSISSLDHYKKVYKNELNKELIRNERINKKRIDENKPKSTYFTKEKAEADAANRLEDNV